MLVFDQVDFSAPVTLNPGEEYSFPVSGYHTFTKPIKITGVKIIPSSFDDYIGTDNPVNDLNKVLNWGDKRFGVSLSEGPGKETYFTTSTQIISLMKNRGVVVPLGSINKDKLELDYTNHITVFSGIGGYVNLGNNLLTQASHTLSGSYLPGVSAFGSDYEVDLNDQLDFVELKDSNGNIVYSEDGYQILGLLVITGANDLTFKANMQSQVNGTTNQYRMLFYKQLPNKTLEEYSFTTNQSLTCYYPLRAKFNIPDKFSFTIKVKVPDFLKSPARASFGIDIIWS